MRSHVIKENEAKNYNSLCGGKASKMATQAAPPPPKVVGLKQRVPMHCGMNTRIA